MLAKRSLSVLKEGIEEGLFSGAAYALVSKKASGGVGTLGRVSFDEDSSRIDRDTLFDVASLTKPLVTAMAIMQLVDRGKLSLGITIDKFFDTPNLSKITVTHLLTHTSGLPPIPVESEGVSVLQNALSSELLSNPGAKFTYSDTGYILLGEIIAHVSGSTLDQYFTTEIAKPLFLEHSRFNPSPDEYTICETSEEAQPGVVHDPRSRHMNGVAGHAGLFASISDIAAYLRALLGTGKALLSENGLALMLRPALKSNIGGMSLGWLGRGNSFMPELQGFSNDCVGHSGFTGCYVVLDKPTQTAACLLTNRVLNTDTDGLEFIALRNRWLNAAAQDLGL